MRNTIDFEIEPSAGTVEIQHKRACGVLSPELETTRTLAQFSPQQDFW
jgi:hypothetical protein